MGVIKQGRCNRRGNRFPLLVPGSMSIQPSRSLLKATKTSERCLRLDLLTERIHRALVRF